MQKKIALCVLSVLTLLCVCRVQAVPACFLSPFAVCMGRCIELVHEHAIVLSDGVRMCRESCEHIPHVSGEGTACSPVCCALVATSCLGIVCCSADSCCPTAMKRLDQIMGISRPGSPVPMNH